MKTNFVKLFAALAVLLLSARAHAAGELTGRVAGYVYDPTGAALSEVPLTIHGTALQQPMSRTTGDEGRFEFENLPPGEDYVVEVNVPGFTPIRQTGIKVRLGQTTISDVHLTVVTEAAATAQTYEIVEKANPVLNPDSAQMVAVITSEKAAETPIFHQVEGMAQQVAGVGPGNRPSTRGGLARHGKFYVDGLDTTDVTDGSITAPMNFDAVENFEIITGGMDAQYNSMGMITNAVTKTGSNKFQLDASLTLNPTWMSGSPNFPASEPSFYGNYVDNPNPSALTSFYSPVVNVGGPIVKDKVWFYASYQQNFSSRGNPISILNQNSVRPTDTTTSLGRFKITAQLSEKDRISFGFNLDRNVINNSLGFSNITDAAESKINRGGEFFIVNYDHTFTDAVLFQLQTGVTFKNANQDPIYSDYTTPSHFDSNQRITQFNSGSISAAQQGNFLHETKWRLQFDPTLSWKMKGLGTHQFKAGFQGSFMIDEEVTGVSGDQRYTDRGGVCNPADSATFSFCSTRIDYTGNKGGALDTQARVLNAGAFIQDRWSVNRQLTIIPGIRLDMGRLWGDPSANPTGDGKFPVWTNLVGLGPRLSATYDVFGDRRTLLTAGYGRNNDVGNVFIAQHGNPDLTQYIATFNTTTGAFPNCVANPTQSGCRLAGGLAGRYIDSHSITSPQTPPHVDELLLGLHHEVAPETVIGIDLNYRKYSNMWADEEQNVIWDPSGTKIVGYVNGQSQSVIKAYTPDSAYRKYASMDLSAQGTPGRWDLLASYTLAYNWGNVGDYFDGYLTNPRMNQFYEGWLNDDQRHTLKGSIAYRTSFGLDIGLRLQYRTGKALWESFTNPGDSTQRLYKSPRGTGAPISSVTGAQDYNDPSQWTELRNPDQFIIDLQGRYNLGGLLHMKERLELVLLVVNATNNGGTSNITDNNSTFLSKFGDASSHFSPLQAEVLIRFRN